MAETVSPAAGRRYGVARVCKVWDVPRSSFYAARTAAADPSPQHPKGRRGPKPAVSDAELLTAIRADLDRSPWSGEGHRKVPPRACCARSLREPDRSSADDRWARLRVLDDLRVSRKRVLRLMRENALLSPHRVLPRPEATHDRKIVTDAPNVMWAIDGTQITTVQDGKVWLFGVAEHWNAELVGWHVSKNGTRHQALQAMSMAVAEQFGQLGPDVARGLALRHDFPGVPTPPASWGGGSAFLADDFHRQVKAWGMTLSYAFVGQPETNGVIERLFRTFKEQVVYGRIFQTIEEVRDAVRAFARRYDTEWLVEKNGHASPAAARERWINATLQMAA